MPPLPPAEIVLDSLRLNILPAAGGAALVMCLFLLLGRWAAALGSAVAIIVGFVWADFTFEKASWDAIARLIPWKLEENAPAWHWMPRAAFVLVVVGLVSRWAGMLIARALPGRLWWGENLLVWAPRVAAVAAASGWVIPAPAIEQWAWVRPAMIGVMVLSWVVLDGMSRTWDCGQVAAYQSLIFFAAGAVLMHHTWNTATELAFILGSAMFGIAVATAVRATAVTGPELLPWEKPPPGIMASGAIPAGVAFLPALLLNARLLAESTLSTTSFWLVALSPLALAPFLIPWVSRQRRWYMVLAGAVLLLIPLGIAVNMAMQAAPPAYAEEW
jgi:hypothetical protein